MSALVSATDCRLRDAITWSVRELAIVASTARPSAPPICWEVLIRPLASPDSCSRTPETAAIVVVTKAKPSPVAASSDGPEHVGEVAAADRDLREPEQPGRDERHPGDQHRLEADARDEL